MDPEDALRQVVWLTPPHSPFGVPVLDCRPFCTTMVSFTQDQRIAETYLRNRQSTGEDHRGREPASPMFLAVRLAYPVRASFADGPIFRAAAMEEKWDVYRHGPQLLMARSWTGELSFIVDGHFSGPEWTVAGMMADSRVAENDPALAVGIVDYLIKSHILGGDNPHPLPASMRGADDRQLAMWSFQQFGRRGRFATFADTTTLPLMPDPL
jgi:hypothetical protein